MTLEGDVLKTWDTTRAQPVLQSETTLPANTQKRFQYLTPTWVR